jgi:hypothetical protein
MMKRLYISILVCLAASLVATAQDPGKFIPNKSRVRYWAMLSDSMQGLPKDTFRAVVNTADYKNYRWLSSDRNKNRLYLWDTVNYKFRHVGFDSIYVRSSTDSVFGRFYSSEVFLFRKDAGAGVYVDSIFSRNDTLIYKKNGVEIAVRKVTDVEAVQDAVGAMINASLQYIDGTPLLAINDRDFGDIIVSSSGLQWDIGEHAVTYDKIQNVSAGNRVLGRLSGGGEVEELTGTDLVSIIDLFTATTAGIVPASGGGSINFLRADGVWSTIPSTLNANIGTGYRLLKPGTQEIKSLVNGYAILMDSTTNASSITFFADTSLLATQYDLTTIAGGTANANIGSGFRILKPSSQEIKSLFSGYGVVWDSTTNTNGLTAKFDSATVFPDLTWERLLLNDFNPGGLGGFYNPVMQYDLEIDMNTKKFFISNATDFAVNLNNNEWAISGSNGGSNTTTIISTDIQNRIRIIAGFTSTNKTEIDIRPDSIVFRPGGNGTINIDSVRNGSTYEVNKLFGWRDNNGVVGYVTPGYGIDLLAGVLKADTSELVTPYDLTQLSFTDTHFGNTNLTQDADRTYDGNGFNYTFNDLGAWQYNFGNSFANYSEGYFQLSAATNVAHNSGLELYNANDENSSAFLYTTFHTLNQSLFIDSTNGIRVQAYKLSGGAFTEMNVYPDSIFIKPHFGQINIDSLRVTATDTAGYKPIVWNKYNHSVRYFNSWGELGLGGGGTSGIDDVLALNQQLTTTREIDASGNTFRIKNTNLFNINSGVTGSGNEFHLQSYGSNSGALWAQNGTGYIDVSLLANSGNGNSVATINADGTNIGTQYIFSDTAFIIKNYYGASGYVKLYIDSLEEDDATGYQLYYNRSTHKVTFGATATGGGGGYTNLTQFVAQNNWKTFYSDGSGDVQELSLGAAGSPFYSTGTSAAPAFFTGVTYATSTTNITFTPLNTTDDLLLLQGISSYTADFLKWKNSGGTTLGSINSAGELLINTTDAGSWTLQNGGASLFSGNARFTGTPSGSAASADRVDIGVEAGTPRMYFEDNGATIWAIDNNAGIFRWFTPGVVQFDLSTASGSFANSVQIGSVLGGSTSPRQLHVVEDNATNNAVTYLTRYSHTTTGTPGIGIGAGEEWRVETGVANFEIGAVMDIVTTDVTSTSEDFDYVIKLMAGGTAAAEKLRVLSTGELKVQLLNQDDEEAKIVVWNSTDKIFEWRDAATLGGSSGLVVGTTTITSGTNTKIFYNNSGVLGEYTIDGTGNVAMTTGTTLTSSFANVAFSPVGNDVATLGTSGLKWSDLYLADGATINFNASNVVLTHSTGILTMGTGDLRITTAGTNTASVATVGGTQTLTNKRVTKRTGTVASSATPTINTDNVDYYSITAQAAAITSFTTNLSGTPTDGQTLWISITDNGTARAITWGASFDYLGCKL